MTTINYNYASGGLLDTPQKYSYSGYFGEHFVNAWQDHRAGLLARLPKPQPIAQHNGKTLTCGDTMSLLHAISEFLQNTDYLTNVPEIIWLTRLVKKFEVTKRVFTSYQQNAPHRPRIDSSYNILELYLKLAECFILAFEKGGELQYLNAFIKIQDSIISQEQQLTQTSQSNLAWLIQKEVTTLNQLMKSKGIA